LPGAGKFQHKRFGRRRCFAVQRAADGRGAWRLLDAVVYDLCDLDLFEKMTRLILGPAPCRVALLSASDSQGAFPRSSFEDAVHRPFAGGQGAAI
jgi:hypothetical protein